MHRYLHAFGQLARCWEKELLTFYVFSDNSHGQGKLLVRKCRYYYRFFKNSHGQGKLLVRKCWYSNVFLWNCQGQGKLMRAGPPKRAALVYEFQCKLYPASNFISNKKTVHVCTVDFGWIFYSTQNLMLNTFPSHSWLHKYARWWSPVPPRDIQHAGRRWVCKSWCGELCVSVA